MSRDKTTKERQEEAAARRHQGKVQEAKGILSGLGAQVGRLGLGSGVLRKPREVLLGQLAWLIAEDEGYQQAAAELWLEQTQDRGNYSQPTNADQGDI